MHICPECGEEYRETVELCPECGVKLIHKKEKEKEKRDSRYRNWEIVYTSSELYQAEIIKSNLESADIECVILNQKDSSFNLDGAVGLVKVLVPKDKVPEALTIIDVVEDFDDSDDFDDEVK